MTVLVRDEAGYADGLCQARLAVDGTEERADELAPVQLDSADIAASEVLRREPLPRAGGRQWSFLDARHFVDRFERVEGALHRIETVGSPCLVSIARQVEAPNGAAFTRIRLYVQHERHRLESQGVAYSPPGRREPGPVVVGVLVAPIAISVDVVTFPVQLAVGRVLYGIVVSHMFDGLELTPHLGLLVSAGVVQPLSTASQCVIEILVPTSAGIILPKFASDRSSGP